VVCTEPRRWWRKSWDGMRWGRSHSIPASSNSGSRHGGCPDWPLPLGSYPKPPAGAVDRMNHPPSRQASHRTRSKGRRRSTSTSSSHWAGAGSGWGAAVAGHSLARPSCPPVHVSLSAVFGRLRTAMNVRRSERVLDGTGTERNGTTGEW
jgi:hypothetical protein